MKVLQLCTAQFFALVSLPVSCIQVRKGSYSAIEKLTEVIGVCQELKWVAEQQKRKTMHVRNLN